MQSLDFVLNTGIYDANNYDVTIMLSNIIYE